MASDWCEYVMVESIVILSICGGVIFIKCWCKEQPWDQVITVVTMPWYLELCRRISAIFFIICVKLLLCIWQRRCTLLDVIKINIQLKNKSISDYTCRKYISRQAVNKLFTDFTDKSVNKEACTSHTSSTKRRNLLI